ncbi:MAG: NUDIX domain-containing protein [Patescibacteria group bacterium]
MGKERHREVPASYAVLLKDGKVLLLRRFNTGYEDGRYSLPAGHVDEGESFSQCAIREAKEEIGINLMPENLKFAHLMHRLSDPEREGLRFRIDVFFVVENWHGEPKIMESDKSDDLSWFDRDKLPENTTPYIKNALECIKNKVFYSEFGWK